MKNHIVLGAVVLLAVSQIALADINCYVCDATDEKALFQCGEWFERYDSPLIKPQNCSGVHEAKYCIKHIGRFEAAGIKCYQCTSAKTINCGSIMLNQPDSPMEPEECDSVHNAKYCILSYSLDS